MTVILLFHYLGIMLSWILEYVSSATVLPQTWKEALSISHATPEGPLAFPFFVLLMDFTDDSLYHGRRWSKQWTCSEMSFHLESSTFSILSKCCFPAFFFSSSLKIVSAIFYQIFIFSPNDIPLKTTKNLFYFISKALFVLEI